MNEWHVFLTAQGARWGDEQLLAFAHSKPESSRKLIPMVEHQMLQAKGADAEKFLQGQSTCDIRELQQSRVLLGAHCNRQGRMLSSYTLTGLPEQAIGLRLRSNIADSTLAAMQRYIVFSKASLEASSLIGLAILGAQEEDLPYDTLPPPGQFAISDAGALMHHHSGLIEIWTDLAQAQTLWQSLTAQYEPAPPSILDQHLITHGIAEVQAQTQERYIPQHFNFQAIGAISFKKGCYTGQEIIARMQYRSQLKKHCYRLISDRSDVQVEIGTELFSPDNLDKKVGEVVASAAGEILAVTTEDVVSANRELIEPKSRINYSWSSLPYAIP